MNILIYLMTILAFVGILGLLIALFIERSQRKRSDAVLKAEISDLFKDVSGKILRDENGEFWPIVKKEIKQEVDGSVSPLLGKIFEIILGMSSAEIKEFLPKFPTDRLIRKILKAIEKMHPSNQNDQEEKKEESPE